MIFHDRLNILSSLPTGEVLKAKELKTGQWFYWENDWRVFARLDGKIEVIDKIECIPALPLEPTPAGNSGYIPAEDTVKIYREKFITLVPKSY